MTLNYSFTDTATQYNTRNINQLQPQTLFHRQLQGSSIFFISTNRFTIQQKMGLTTSTHLFNDNQIITQYPRQ